MTSATQAEDALVAIEGLSRRYGTTRALDGVDLRIEEGTVLGLVGRNGAGKTTLIRHVLGLLRAQEGKVRVFGLDPVRHPERVLSGIGFVSEERDLPSWMRIGELLRYQSAFHTSWDPGLATDLCRSFALDPSQRVRTLSRGQHVRTSLVLALAPRPPLLVLDEPSSGLDPAVRRDVLETVLRNVVSDGRTVLFSSHLLDEVERLSDRLAMIESGRILFHGDLHTVLETFRLVELRRPPGRPTPAGTGERLPRVKGIREVFDRRHGSTPAPGSEVDVLVRLDENLGIETALEHARREWRRLGFEILDVGEVSLDEVFLRLCGDEGRLG